MSFSNRCRYRNAAAERMGTSTGFGIKRNGFVAVGINLCDTLDIETGGFFVAVNARAS
jgi:hypothetical protein